MLDWLRRLGPRWIICYLILYMVFGFTPLMQFIDAIPGSSWVTEAEFWMWSKVVPWVGEHILGFAHPIKPSLGADTLFIYTETGILLIIALMVAVVWTCLERDRRREQALHEITRVLVRYALAMFMFVYGFSKTMHYQFDYPGPADLMTPLGDFPPAGLMGTFMGYSTIYSFFAGSAEFIGGALLLFRRTTTLGALVIAGVMTNVVIMNISFYLIIKLFAAQILFMAIFLLAPDVQRLVNAIVLYRPGPFPAISFKRAWPKPWMGPASVALKVLVIGWLLCYALTWSLMIVREHIASHKMTTMEGLYRVEHFRSRSAPSLIRDGASWERVAIEGEVLWNLTSSSTSEWNLHLGETLTVRTADDAINHYQLHITSIDSTHGVLKLTQLPGAWLEPKGHGAAPRSIVLRYTVVRHSRQAGNAIQPTNEVLTLNGNADGAPVSMELDRLDTRNFALMQPFPLFAPIN